MTIYHGFTKEQFRTACHNRFMHWSLYDFILNEQEFEDADNITLAVHNLAMGYFSAKMIHPVAHLVDDIIDGDNYSYLINLMSHSDVSKYLDEG